MSQSPQHDTKPPSPPEIVRRIHLYPFQWAGFLYLFLIPVLALFGVFGETRVTLQESTGEIELTVTYTSRAHFHGPETTRILVRNTRAEAIPVMRVTIDRSFLDNYADLSFTPDIAEITVGGFVIELTDIAPDETRVILLDSRGKVPGLHQGSVTASTGEQQVIVKLEVFIFP